MMNDYTIYNMLDIVAYLCPRGYEGLHHNQKQHIISFIAKNFGNKTTNDGIIILKNIIERNRTLQINGREDAIYSNLRGIGAALINASYETKMGLLAFFIGLYLKGRYIDTERLHNVALLLGLEESEVDIILSMLFPQTEETPRERALSALELPANASGEEIKKAFRRLSLKYHPDRNQDKSVDEQKEAEHRFKEIVAAKQLLDEYDYE